MPDVLPYLGIAIAMLGFGFSAIQASDLIRQRARTPWLHAAVMFLCLLAIFVGVAASP